LIELRASELALGLVPEIGGSVAYFRSKDRDLLRPLSDDARRSGNVLGVAMFPMVPFANRIADNQFTFRRRTHQFSPNNPPDRFHVHGSGWQMPWRVAECSVSQAVLEVDYLRPDEPYSYRAVQRFQLFSDALVVGMAITNRGGFAMPFGFGQHPWFERDADVTLQFTARQFWLEGPDHIATEAISIAPQLDFRSARLLPTTWRNNDYGGWAGTAEVRYPSRGVGLRIDADPVFRHLMFYADPTKSFFCVEPQTNAVCAFNRAEEGDADELGILVLNPGDTAQGTLRFTPLSLQPF
jgi:aldose 1-epimerase